MSVTDELLKNNEGYAASFDKGSTPLPPARGVAVVACMDARLHVNAILGLEVGDAHIIRNAGGVVTDDAIRSLVISQRLLGTTEIILIHHSDCGMVTFTDDAVKAQIKRRRASGRRSRWRRSRMRRMTCVSPSRASSRTRSSRVATAFADSFMTSPPAS